jgi:protease I
MAAKLNGKKVAVLATDGVEEIELTEPREALERAGATVEVVSPKPGEIQAMDHMDRNHLIRVDRLVSGVDRNEYASLVLPGGVSNGDKLRIDEASQDFVRSFFDRQLPVGVICQGGWILVETGVVNGRTMTPYPTLRTDIRNAGGTWVDEEVHNDRGLVSSRRVVELSDFCAKIVEEIARGPSRRARGLSGVGAGRAGRARVERGVRVARVGGGDAVPAQSVHEGGELARRVEALGSEILPTLLFEDAPVDLVSPIDRTLLALSVVVGAGEANEGRCVGRVGRDDFFNEPAP